MEIRYKQLLTSPILLLLLLVIVAQSAEKLQEQQQQKSQEESSLETLEADRLKRASGMKENSDGGIIIDVNNGDYPNENYYYDNYDFSNSNNENNNVERPSTSFNLNNTYKVESHVLNDDNEDVVDDSGAAVVHIESGTSGKKKPTVPPFIPNESDDSGAAGLRIMDPIDEDDDGDDTYGGADDESDAGIIKIDSPPQFKPSHQQTFNTDKTALNNNREPSKSSDLTTKSTSQQRLINLKKTLCFLFNILGRVYKICNIIVTCFTRNKIGLRYNIKTSLYTL